MTDQAATLKAATVRCQELAATLMAGYTTEDQEATKQLDDLHRHLFGTLYGGDKNMPHSDAVTMASLPLWPAAHHSTNAFYFKTKKEHVAALGTVLSLLPRVSDSRCFVTEQRLAVSTQPGRLPLEHVTAPTSLEEEEFFDKSKIAAHRQEVSAATAEKGSPPLDGKLALLDVFEATSCSLKLQQENMNSDGTINVRNAIGDLRKLAEKFKRAMQCSVMEGTIVETPTVAPASPGKGPQTPQFYISKDDKEDLFSLRNVEYAATVLLFAVHIFGNEGKDVLDTLTFVLARDARWTPHLQHLPSFCATQSAFGSVAASTASATRTIDPGMINRVFNAANDTSKGILVLKDTVLEAIKASDATPESLYTPFTDTTASKNDEDGDDEDEEEPKVSNAQAMRSRAEEALGKIGQEVDFMGESSSARDLDAVTRTIRDCVYTPVGGENDGERFNKNFVKRLLFDRTRRGVGKGPASAGNKRDRSEMESVADDSSAAITEARAVMPVVSSMGDMFGSGDSGEGQKELLERLALGQ